MINVFNHETNHHHGDTYSTLLKCRHREFVVQHKYDVPSYNGMEYDQYDTPAAVYFTWKDGDGEVRAGLRMTPTNRPYMIKDLWPQTVQDVEIPNTPTIWEATRLFIDRRIDQKLRHQAHGEILCAMLEFGLHYGITDFIATAPPNLWQYTFIRCGWPLVMVGPPTDIGYSEQIQTCLMNVSETILDNVRKTMNISGSVFSFFDMLRDEDVLVEKGILTPTRQLLRASAQEVTDHAPSFSPALALK